MKRASPDPLLTGLRALPDATRADVLRQACVVVPALSKRIGELTTLLADSGSQAMASNPDLTAPEAHALEWALEWARELGESTGTRVGPYTLHERLGEGGFGTVWRARQEHPVRREVALKILKVGMDTKEVVARFEAERQALALMDHSGIAHVYDTGATDSGRPYLVMELVAGAPINRFCDERRLGIAARLRLFIAVCQAVQHAHQKGIIHRDLKPMNILVSLQDDTPVPKIIDFGIAKATAQPLTDKSFHTQFHTFLGTPVYSSPEQVEGRLHEVDTRSDLYSLGVVLYELLSGTLPFDPDSLTSSGIEEMRRIVREVDPPRPSTRFRTLAKGDRRSIAQLRGSDPGKLAVRLHGDLDWIVARCLEKDRARRYESAGSLAADVEHFLRSEPVLARPPSTSYRVVKFVRRHRLGVAAAVAVIAALILGVVGSTWQALRATRAERETARALAGETAARRSAEAVVLETSAQELVIGEAYGDNTEALALAVAALERGDSWERRRLALGALWKAPTYFVLPPAGNFEPHDWSAFSPGGHWFATGTDGSDVLLWPADGGVPTVLPGDPDFRTQGVSFSPRGRWLLADYQMIRDPPVYYQGPHKQILWDVLNRKRHREWKVERWAPHWFSPDESRMLAYSVVKEIPYAGMAWWSIEDGAVTPLGSPREQPPLMLRFPPWFALNFYPSADLRSLVSWEGCDVYISRIGEKSLDPRIWVGRHDRAVKSTSLDAHGDLVSSADDLEMRIWSRSSPGNPLVRVPSSYTPAIFDAARRRVFVRWPNANVLCVSYDLRGPAGAEFLPYLPLQGSPCDPCLLPGGNWIAMCNGFPIGGNRPTTFFPMKAAWPYHIDLDLEPTSEPKCVRLSPHGQLLASDRDGRLVVTDLAAEGRPSRVVFEAPGRRYIGTFEFDRRSEHLLVGTLLSGAWWVPLGGDEAKRIEGAPSYTAAVAFSPSGRRLALGGGSMDLAPAERYARVFDRDGRLLARMDSGRQEAVTSIGFLTESELIVATDGGLWSWKTDSGEVRLLREGSHSLMAMSDHLFLTRDAEHVWFYDRATLEGKPIESIGVIGVVALAISANEDFIVSRNNRGTIQVVHLGSGRSHSLPGNDSGRQALWIDPHGYWIVAVNHAGKLSYWPMPRGEPLQDRPIQEFLAVLKAQTNLRAVPDPEHPQGYRTETEPFPGWETTPTWQEWYSEDYMADPPWTPMLDLEAVLEEGGKGEGEGKGEAEG